MIGAAGIIGHVFGVRPSVLLREDDLTDLAIDIVGANAAIEHFNIGGGFGG